MLGGEVVIEEPLDRVDCNTRSMEVAAMPARSAAHAPADQQIPGVGIGVSVLAAGASAGAARAGVGELHMGLLDASTAEKCKRAPNGRKRVDEIGWLRQA